MPTYDYRCTKCGHRFELFHGIKDETRRRCPKCRSKAERVPAGGAGLLFKGTGFYITDHRSKSYREAKKKESSGGSGGSGSPGDSGGSSGSSGSGGTGGSSTSGPPS